MSLHRPLEFDTVAIVGGKELRTDEQEDHGSAVQVVVDGLFPIGASNDLAHMPQRDLCLSLQEAQVLLKRTEKRFVGRRISAENLDGCWRRLHRSVSSPTTTIGSAEYTALGAV